MNMSGLPNQELFLQTQDAARGSGIHVKTLSRGHRRRESGQSIIIHVESNCVACDRFSCVHSATISNDELGSTTGKLERDARLPRLAGLQEEALWKNFP